MSSPYAPIPLLAGLRLTCSRYSQITVLSSCPTGKDGARSTCVASSEWISLGHPLFLLVLAEVLAEPYSCLLGASDR